MCKNQQENGKTNESFKIPFQLEWQYLPRFLYNFFKIPPRYVFQFFPQLFPVSFPRDICQKTTITNKGLKDKGLTDKWLTDIKVILVMLPSYLGRFWKELGRILETTVKKLAGNLGSMLERNGEASWMQLQAQRN